MASCACGCGEMASEGRAYRRGHNKRQPWTWRAEDRGYETPCWIWGGPSRNRAGYGAARVDGRIITAHRAVYLALEGPIPDGLTLDHLCRVRCCVNPAHLEPVTQAENIRRGEAPAALNARKTHCVRGHEFTPENTNVRPCGRRECLACRKITNAQRTRVA